MMRLTAKAVFSLVLFAVALVAVPLVFSAGQPPPGTNSTLASYDGLAVDLLQVATMLVVELVVLDEIAFADVDTEAVIADDGLRLALFLGLNAVGMGLCFA